MKIRKLFIDGKEYGKVGIADSFFLRLRGLLGRKFNGFDALLIQPCSSVHTFFMQYSIDVVFIDRNGNVLKTAENVKPWVPYVGGGKAYSVIELPAGEIRRQNIQKRDFFSIS